MLGCFFETQHSIFVFLMNSGLCSVRFCFLSKRLAGKRNSKMTYSVSSGTLNLDQLISNSWLW